MLTTTRAFARELESTATARSAVKNGGFWERRDGRSEDAAAPPPPHSAVSRAAWTAAVRATRSPRGRSQVRTGCRACPSTVEARYHTRRAQRHVRIALDETVSDERKWHPSGRHPTGMRYAVLREISFGSRCDRLAGACPVDAA